MRARFCVCITLLALSHPQLWGQTLTRQLPPGERTPAGAQIETPEAAGDGGIPVAEPVTETPVGTQVTIRSRTQNKQGSLYTLRGEVEIDYQSYVIRADEIRYDTATGEMTAEGHLQVDGGPRAEHIAATNGRLNVERQTGRFYNVTGVIGAKPAPHRAVYAATNPFLFTGKVLEKNGPDQYLIREGSMTSCSLPKPDWLLSAKMLEVNGTTARGKNVIFRLLNVPLVYLPYATHGTNVQERRTGFLIPTIGTSSTKGTIVGEAIYVVLGRSTDLTVGAEYYSLRGFAQSADFRYRGNAMDSLRVRYNGLLDRGLGPTHIDQGGEDVTIAGRRDFSAYTRTVADAEYLSSYQYRQAFTENFSLAVASEVKSIAFVTHEKNGVAASARFDRYQSFLNVVNEQEIRILHLPSLDADIAEHRVGRTGLYYGLESSAAGLSRAAPGFQTSSPTGRVDVHPHLSLPLVLDGASLRPSIGVRETYYSGSELSDCCIPVQLSRSLNREAFEAGVEARTPTLERVFGTSGKSANLWKHTVSGYAHYRYVAGIGNFARVLRYDPIDIESDTNEIEYGVTQRIFRRSLRRIPCAAGVAPEVPGGAGCGDAQPAEWLSWRVAQKYFFDPTFGGAVIAGRRNVLETTLDFSAAAYLTRPRSVSPVVSRLRVQPAEHLEAEWDVEYDTKAGRSAAANVFANYRRHDYFAGIGHSRLDAPGEPPQPGSLRTVRKFNQLRFTLGYGDALKAGFSAAANAGLDLGLTTLQYAAVQTNYNWNCCGLSIEYRRFSLGSARNENQYRFNFTLAGVGTAGSLRRAERLF